MAVRYPGIRRLRRGDRVEWNTPQGKTRGTVERRLASTAHSGGHVAQPDAQHPGYEVRSEASGETAIHRPESLRPIRTKR